MLRKIAIITVMALALGPLSIPQFVHAQTGDTVSVESSSSATVTTDTSVSKDTSSTTSGEDVPTSGWGLFWFGVRERFSLLTTFDPVAKAQKALNFAEERQKIAEKLSTKTDDPKIQERLDKMLERAQQLEDKADSVKDKLLNNPDARAKLLLKNLLDFKANKEEMFSKLEEKLTPDQLEKLQTLKSQAEEKGKALLNALENSNIPEDVKAHLEEVKARIEAHQAEVKQFQDAQKALLDRIKSGDESAKEELKTLREDRADEIKSNTEERREDRQEFRQTIRTNTSTTRPVMRVLEKREDRREGMNTTTRPESRPQVRPILPLRERPNN